MAMMWVGAGGIYKFSRGEPWGATRWNLRRGGEGGWERKRGGSGAAWRVLIGSCRGAAIYKGAFCVENAWGVAREHVAGFLV